MQSAIHPAFMAKIAVLAALLERSQTVRAEAKAKLGGTGARYQAQSKGGTWDVVEVTTGRVYEAGVSYLMAMRLVDAMESEAVRQ